MSNSIFPDLTDTIISFLSAHSNLTDVTRVTVDLVGFQEGDLWVEVTDAGGVRLIERRLDAPRFDFNVYAPTKKQAKNLANRVNAALYDMRNYHDGSVVVTKIQASLPTDLTDLVDKQPRYVFDATVTYRPA